MSEKLKIMEKKPVAQDVRLAVYWKSLNELDLYQSNHTVKTVVGADVENYLQWMHEERINFEVID